MWEFFAALASLVLLLFKELFNARSEANLAKKQFLVDQTVFRSMVVRALGNLLTQDREDSAIAVSLEDQIAADLARRKLEASKK